MYAHRLIQRLEEFGPAYFELSVIVPVSPESYRRIAGSVRPEGIEIDSKVVAIKPENASRIRHLLETSRAAEAPEDKKVRARSIPDVKQRLDACIRDLDAISETATDVSTRSELRGLMGGWIDRLKRVGRLP